MAAQAAVSNETKRSSADHLVQVAEELAVLIGHEADADDFLSHDLHVARRLRELLRQAAGTGGGKPVLMCSLAGCRAAIADQG